MTHVLCRSVCHDKFGPCTLNLFNFVYARRPKFCKDKKRCCLCTWEMQRRGGAFPQPPPPHSSTPERPRCAPSPFVSSARILTRALLHSNPPRLCSLWHSKIPRLLFKNPASPIHTLPSPWQTQMDRRGEVWGWRRRSMRRRSASGIEGSRVVLMVEGVVIARPCVDPPSNYS